MIHSQMDFTIHILYAPKFDVLFSLLLFFLYFWEY